MRLSLTSQTIPTGIQTPISWETQEVDSEDWWDPGVPDRFTLPPGVFVIVCWAEWNVSGTGQRITSVREVPSGTLGRVSQAAVSGALTEQTIAALAEHTIETPYLVEVRQDSGADLVLAFAQVYAYQVMQG